MARPVVPDRGLEDEGSSDSELSDGDEIYLVDRILAERKIGRITEYLVKWQNFDEVACTWEPADSFDTPVTISLWEIAREQGDTLDLSELQDLEQKMARYLAAEKEKRKAARQERKASKQARNTASHVRGAIESSTTSKVPFTGNIATLPPPSVPVKRKASLSHFSRSKAESVKPSKPTAPPPAAASSRDSSIPIISQAAPANQNQTFHTLSSDRHPAGRRTTGTHGNPAPSARDGQPYRNLSHQNNANKLRRQEPAPNMSQIRTLLPLTELPAVHDVALNLPSGPPPLQRARYQVQDVFVESTNGNLNRQLELAADVMSAVCSTTRSTGLGSGRSEPPPHQQISHAVSQSAPQPNQSLLHLRYGSSYLYYQWGELVVQIRVGTRLIGHVKIVGLARPGQDSSPLIAAILQTRDSSVLGMTFEQEDATNLQDYKSFEYEVGATGSLEPYDNARDSFYQLLTFFEMHSTIAAVWRHGKVPWIMVAYSSRAPAFVEKGFPSVSGGLAFIVCRRVPWHNAPLPVARIQPPTRAEDIDMSLDSGVDDLGIPTPMVTRPSPDFALPVEVDDVSEPMAGMKATMSTAQVNNKVVVLDSGRVKATDDPLSKKQPHLGLAKIDKLSFEKKYGITYEGLTRVPSKVKPLSENGKFNRHMVSFYLAFAEDKTHEEAELKNWLTSRTPAYMIYSSSEAHAWERYKLALHSGDHDGIILIHGDFLLAAFRIMKGLANHLRRENLQIFRVSLERPLEDSSLRNFGKIFPSGLVVLITEATILDSAAETADLLDWFAGIIKMKPSWRLFLRPQPQDYLRDLCETDICKADRASHEKSLILLESLQLPPSTTSTPLTSPHDDDESSSCVLAPLSLPVFSNGVEGSSLVTSNTKKIAERDAKLVNFFCGWAFDQVSNFRRFVAITADVSEEIRKRNPQVDFLTLADFEKLYMPKKNAAKLRTPADSPMSPAVKNAALKQTWE